jgi:hypothetical protein
MQEKPRSQIPKGIPLHQPHPRRAINLVAEILIVNDLQAGEKARVQILDIGLITPNADLTR